MNEYEFEPVKGLPAELPDGEHIVWQGSPKWQSLAVRAFHVRKVAIYFLALITLCIGSSFIGQDSFLSIMPSIKMQLIVGSIAIGLLVGLAYAYSSTTIYTVTNRRIVMRFGVAVQMMINLPWEKIDSAGICEFADNTGDILIKTNSEERISYWVLWPHARPWRLRTAQPLLRSLPDAKTAAKQVSKMLEQQVSVQHSNKTEVSLPASPMPSPAQLSTSS